MRLPGLIALLAFAFALAAPVPASGFFPGCCFPFGQPGQPLVSPDGRHVYVADQAATLALERDAETGALRLIDSYTGGGLTYAMTPDGRYIHLAGDRVPSIKVFERGSDGTLTDRGVWTPDGAANWFMDLAVSPDGRTIYVSDWAANAIHVSTLDYGTGLARSHPDLRVEGIEGVGGLALSADGRFVYASAGVSSADGPAAGIRVFRRDAGSGALTPLQELACACAGGQDLELSPDGRVLFTGAAGPHHLIVDPDTGLLTETPASPIAINSGGGVPDAQVVASPGSRTLYAVDGFGARLVQFALGGDGLTAVQSYPNGAAGLRGLHPPVGAGLAPDGRHLYVTGGPEAGPDRAGNVVVMRRNADDSLAFASVFEGPYFDGRPHGSGPAPSVTINSGTSYTDDPHVTLAIVVPPRGISAYEVANDGGFGGSGIFARGTGTVSWTLASTGPERLPKTVYVRLLGFGPLNGQVLTDDIVLDERRPVVTSARLVSSSRRRARASGLRVRVWARDRVSGVASVQVTTRRARPGKWRRYRRNTTYATRGRRSYVRVRDRAGNRSAWRRAKAGR